MPMRCALGCALLLGLTHRSRAVVGGACNSSDFPASVLSSQSDLEAIRADCSKIEGSVSIKCASGTTDPITSLAVFSLVEEITGFLRIDNCDELASFMPGFESLKVVHGRSLFSDENGDGFALYVANNDRLTTLGGLQNMSSIEGDDVKGLGRVRILGNPFLCWGSKVNWATISGANWRRAVYDLPDTTNCNIDTLSCHASCSCNLCVGPGQDECQGTCTGYESDHDAVTATFLGLLMLFGVILLFFLILYVTDRCGCHVKFFSKELMFGIEQTQRHKRASATAVDDFTSKHDEMKAREADDPFSAPTLVVASDPLGAALQAASRPGSGASKGAISLEGE